MKKEIHGYTYQPMRISAREQFHLARKLAPALAVILPALVPAKFAEGTDPTVRGLAALEPVGRALAALPDADADAILFGLLNSTQRQAVGGGWAAVVAGSVERWDLQFQDITMPDMLQIAWLTLQHNLAGFTDALPSGLIDKLKPSAA